MTALQEREDQAERESLSQRILADRAPARELSDQSERSHRVLDSIGAVFYAIGWVIGAVVSILGFMIGAVRYGYRQGRLVIPPPPRLPSQPQPEPGRT
jgi:hypothetical protein